MSERITSNKSCNRRIEEAFRYLSENDVARFKKGFRELQDVDNANHALTDVYRELLLGAYLGICGFKVKYEKKLDGFTPDWQIVDKEDQIECLVELQNLHLDQETQDDIDAQMKEHGHAGYHPDARTDYNFRKLTGRIRTKIEKYQPLVEAYGVGYIVAISPDWLLSTPQEDIERAISAERYFDEYEYLSGILYFAEVDRRYIFKYYQNPDATYSFHIPGGQFSQWQERVTTTSASS